MVELDDYIQNVIKSGDEISRYLAESSASTLKNNGLVRVLENGMNGLAVLKIPEDKICAAVSVGGDPSLKDVREYAMSAVDRAVGVIRSYGFSPIGMADVIDASVGKLENIKMVQDGLVEAANSYKIPIMNGELAVLSDRVNGVANVTATVIGTCSRDGKNLKNYFDDYGIACFDPKGQSVYVNCDGIGTKGEFGERDGTPWVGLRDSSVMKVDDLIKVGGKFMATCENVEYSGEIDRAKFLSVAKEIENQLGGSVALSFENMGNRIAGYKPGALATNFSGTSFSVIDEYRLKNPLKPRAGDVLIAVRGKPNPRSNGISERREIMVDMFGLEWHKTEQGKLFMPFLKEPSTMLYPLFSGLINSGYATGVFHLSGGAYNGKLARPLAKEGLYVELDNLFTPDWRDWAMVKMNNDSAQRVYGKRPMGTDGFFSVPSDYTYVALDYVKEHGLEGRIVGKIEKAKNSMTGVSLKAANGERVYFSGRD